MKTPWWAGSSWQRCRQSSQHPPSHWGWTEGLESCRPHIRTEGNSDRAEKRIQLILAAFFKMQKTTIQMHSNDWTNARLCGTVGWFSSLSGTVLKKTLHFKKVLNVESWKRERCNRNQNSVLQIVFEQLWNPPALHRPERGVDICPLLWL